MDYHVAYMDPYRMAGWLRFAANEHQVKINQRNENTGNTALTYAIMSNEASKINQYRSIVILLQFGATLDARKEQDKLAIEILQHNPVMLAIDKVIKAYKNMTGAMFAGKYIQAFDNLIESMMGEKETYKTVLECCWPMILTLAFKHFEAAQQATGKNDNLSSIEYKKAFSYLQTIGENCTADVVAYNSGIRPSMDDHPAHLMRYFALVFSQNPALQKQAIDTLKEFIDPESDNSPFPEKSTGARMINSFFEVLPAAKSKMQNSASPAAAASSSSSAAPAASQSQAIDDTSHLPPVNTDGRDSAFPASAPLLRDENKQSHEPGAANLSDPHSSVRREFSLFPSATVPPTENITLDPFELIRRFKNIDEQIEGQSSTPAGIAKKYIETQLQEFYAKLANASVNQNPEIQGAISEALDALSSHKPMEPDLFSSKK